MNTPSPYGTYPLNKRLIRRVGVEAALLFTELAETSFGLTTPSNEWFLWDGIEFVQTTGWDDETLKNAFQMLVFNKLAWIRKTESADVIEFKLNFYQFENICELPSNTR